MRIAIGSDPWGCELKEAISKHLAEKGHELTDVGAEEEGGCLDYTKASMAVARLVQSGAAERGIVFCGTGMGVAIVANKFKGVYAGLIESEHAAKMCKVINNCNVLAMGGMFVSAYKAELAVDAWLEATHTEGLDDELTGFLKRSLAEIAELEESLCGPGH